jgi:DNA-binding GntR family transcriptional regulator
MNNQEREEKMVEFQNDSGKIMKSTLRVEVAERIRKMIFENQLKPGERIIETKLAREFGVSQSPIREAIRELELMSLLENVPFKGCVVKELLPKDIVNRYKIRSALETLAIREATVKMNPSAITELQDLLRLMKSAAKRKQKVDFINMDIMFHKKIIQIADNQLLDKMWEMVSLGQWTNVTVNISEMGLEELAQRHEKLLELMKSDDPDGAANEMRMHIEDLMNDIINKMEQGHEKQQTD